MLVDEVGNTDWYITAYDIQVQAVLNMNYIATIFPSLALGTNTAGQVLPLLTRSPADIVKIIRGKLLQPRQQLSFKFNGYELIPTAITGNPGTVDSQNGPKPLYCNIVQLNNETFLVDYRITARYWENLSTTTPYPPTNFNGNVVLYNRWTETVEIDKANYTKRLREGNYVIRSDNTLGRTADGGDRIRNRFATLGVPSGFIRESARYTVTPDGLGIQYNIVDREVYKYPPKPAYEASGKYTEISSRGGGKRYGHVQVHLKGSKDGINCSQASLVALAAAVCGARLLIGASTAAIRQQSNIPLRAFIGIIEKAVLTVDMYENEVECQMQALFAKTRQQLAGVGGMDFEDPGFTASPFSDGVDARQPRYLTYGTAGYGLRAAAYFDPSLFTALNAATGQMDGGLMPGEAGRTREVIDR